MRSRGNDRVESRSSRTTRDVGPVKMTERKRRALARLRRDLALDALTRVAGGTQVEDLAHRLVALTLQPLSGPSASGSGDDG